MILVCPYKEKEQKEIYSDAKLPVILNFLFLLMNE